MLVGCRSQLFLLAGRVLVSLVQKVIILGLVLMIFSVFPVCAQYRRISSLLKSTPFSALELAHGVRGGEWPILIPLSSQ